MDYQSRFFRTLRCALFLLLFGSGLQELSAQQTELYRNPVGVYNLGLEYYDKGLYSAAQKEFERMSELMPNENSDITVNSEFYSALCALRLFHRDAALRLREFIRKHPESSRVRDAKFQLGSYYHLKKDWQKAIEWFNEVDPYDLSKSEWFEYKFKLGYAQLMEKDLEAASRNFYEIKDIDNPYTDPSRYYFAHISYTKENFQTALADFEKLADHPKFGPLVPYYKSQILYNQKKYSDILEYAPPLMETVIEKRKPELARIIGEAYYYERQYKEALPYLEMYEKESRVLNNDDRYQLAYTYYKTADYKKAIKGFGRLTSLKNEMAQTSAYHLADCYVKTGMKGHARSAFKKAYDLGFDEKIAEESLFNYARLSYEEALDPYKTSVDAFKEYIARYPESPRIDDAYNYLIAVYLTTKNYDAALASIQNVKSKTPQLKGAYQKIAFNKATLLYQNRAYEDAIRYYDKSHTYKESEKLTALGFYWKGEARYRLREFDNAIENYQAFIYETAAILTPQFNLANYNVAYCHFKKKNFTEANVWFRKFIYTREGIDTFKLTDALLRIADGYFVMKDYSKAIDFYTQAEEIGAFDADYALFQRAVCQGILKDYPGKIKSLEELIAENPGSTYLDPAYYELGRAYDITGDRTKALASFGEVIQQANQNVYLKKSLIQTGLIHYQTENYTEAINVFTRIVQDYPTYEDTKEALVVLQNIYIERGQVDVYRQLIAGLPFVDVTQEQLDTAVFKNAELAYLNDDCKTAITSLKSYLGQFEAPSQNLKANYYLANCYYRSEDYQNAIKHYQVIAALPSNEYSEEAYLKSAEHFFTEKNYSEAFRNYSALEISATSAPNVRKAAGGKLESAFRLDSAQAWLEAGNSYIESGFDDAELLGIAFTAKARNAMAGGNVDNALEYFEIVKDTTQSVLGAEAIYSMAKIHFDRDSLEESKKLVFVLVNRVPSYGEWVAKSLMLLSDIYLVQEDYFQSKAVLQTIIKNYEDEGFKNLAKDKLKEIELLESKEDEKQEEAPEVELNFDENEDLDYDSIDALFEEEELDEELELENENNEGGDNENK